MADGDAALLAHELAVVLALQNGIGEHPGGADKIHAVVGQIVLPCPLVPLEHPRLWPRLWSLLWLFLHARPRVGEPRRA